MTCNQTSSVRHARAGVAMRPVQRPGCRDTSGLTPEVNKLSYLGRQVVIGVMLVGLIIGSAIATIGIGLGEFQGEFWNLINQIAILGYVFSSVIAMVIVLAAVWRWLRGSPPGHD